MKASVLITSYNHADTLRRAIVSVLMQKTKYKYEVILIDDGSTDHTRKVLKNYLDGSIQIIANKHQGMMATYQDGFRRCKGKYITLCDGDDYWTDPHRLQKQIDFMDANPDCGFSVTRVTILQGNIFDSGYTPIEVLRNRMTFDNLLKGNADIHAQGYMIRRSTFEKYCNFEMFARKFHVWDYPILLTLINHTRFAYLNFHSAVFVKKDESFTQTQSRLKRLKYILGTNKIRIYFIWKYGCKLSTLIYLIYLFIRSIYSIIFKRWTKN